MTGSGTALDPFLIYDVNDLQAMNNDLDAYYELANDIDASATSGWNGGAGFVPIGTYAIPFEGHFDGKGFSITSLFISRNLESIGLFGAIDGGTAQNVSLVNFNLTGLEGVVAYVFVGALIGWLETGTITLCNSSGTMTIAKSTGYAGGLIGHMNSGTVTKCYSTCEVISTAGGFGADIGGFAGNIYGGSVDQCFATGDVSETVSTGSLGGFVARVGWGGDTPNPSISNCYARGAVTGFDPLNNWNAGGFCYVLGQGTIENCYSTGAVNVEWGGFIQINYDTVTDCFWDIETSGQINSDAGTGKTTAQMKTKSTFTDAGWDFTAIWGIFGHCNAAYPCLREVTPSCSLINYPQVRFI